MLAEFDTMLMLVWSKSALVDVAWFPCRPPAMLPSDWWSCRLSLDINFISHCTRVTHQMSWSRERWCWLQCWPGLPHHQPVKQSDLMSPLLPGWAELSGGGESWYQNIVRVQQLCPGHAPSDSGHVTHVNQIHVHPRHASMVSMQTGMRTADPMVRTNNHHLRNQLRVCRAELMMHRVHQSQLPAADASQLLWSTILSQQTRAMQHQLSDTQLEIS